ncbi:MAG: serine/threonine protein kinase [Planctomycetota bacterium]|nr:MAG: serine/threonine protein kinase [Planctomycetota bacterium]REJ91203.1 MAG: serine/threonine protein kinase [Planctomycetota bacterium]REK22204.1 MAG: serine/threonine protein kinase [Planctomycetota bacterium]REK44274.1 MAG: serine/threonine protein kinase [Planctomycetota bacterium]
MAVRPRPLPPRRPDPPIHLPPPTAAVCLPEASSTVPPMDPQIEPSRRSSPRTAPRRVVGPWQLGQRLARSQQSAVYRARPADGSSHAPYEYLVKLLPETLRGDGAALARFRREVCVGGKVDHPHLVPVVDAELEQPPLFLVMPRLAGTTVRELLVAAGRIDWPTACWMGRQTAQALGHLHELGWLHGDVKPDNLLVADDGHLTLLDLGMLQPLGGLRIDGPVVRDDEGDRKGASADETSPWDECARRASLQGTLAYLAPEQILRAGVPTRASDLFSLGMTLYEMIAGRHPLADLRDAELIRAQLYEPVADVRDYEPSVPESLADLIAQLLAKHPLRRPSDAHVVTRHLVEVEIRALQKRRASA